LDSSIDQNRFIDKEIKTMTKKEESEAAAQFVEEWVLVMEAERTLSSRLSDSGT